MSNKDTLQQTCRPISGKFTCYVTRYELCDWPTAARQPRNYETTLHTDIFQALMILKGKALGLGTNLELCWSERRSSAAWKLTEGVLRGRYPCLRGEARRRALTANRVTVAATGWPGARAHWRWLSLSQGPARRACDGGRTGLL